ncbi:hypothetical protein GCM10011578_038470 [Streptomyces fuscichromogenes]|uniref:Uncharacterized protein n=1 Tax=Streptomyces fuscichromogenes TaxID=1324013 RepID=A0A917XDC8_9ACTN|nr:hypothetical protein GCM10011578_038470 [Streptomyces fuscichromogenes]
MRAPLSSCRVGSSSGSFAARGRYPNRHTPGAASGLGARSQARKAEPSGSGGMAGGAVGRGGIADASVGVTSASCGPAGRGTGFACVRRVSRVPSLSIALAP